MPEIKKWVPQEQGDIVLSTGSGVGVSRDAFFVRLWGILVGMEVSGDFFVFRLPSADNLLLISLETEVGTFLCTFTFPAQEPCVGLRISCSDPNFTWNGREDGDLVFRVGEDGIGPAVSAAHEYILKLLEQVCRFGTYYPAPAYAQAELEMVRASLPPGWKAILQPYTGKDGKITHRIIASNSKIPTTLASAGWLRFEVSPTHSGWVMSGILPKLKPAEAVARIFKKPMPATPGGGSSSMVVRSSISGGRAPSGAYVGQPRTRLLDSDGGLDGESG